MVRNIGEHGTGRRRRDPSQASRGDYRGMVRNIGEHGTGRRRRDREQ